MEFVSFEIQEDETPLAALVPEIFSAEAPGQAPSGRRWEVINVPADVSSAMQDAAAAEEAVRRKQAAETDCAAAAEAEADAQEAFDNAQQIIESLTGDNAR